jgi:hypothetical protein
MQKKAIYDTVIRSVDSSDSGGEGSNGGAGE